MTSRERFQFQFDNLTPKPPVKPITGIQRAAKESEDTRKMWIELQKFNQ